MSDWPLCVSLTRFHSSLILEPIYSICILRLMSHILQHTILQRDRGNHVFPLPLCPGSYGPGIDMSPTPTPAASRALV
jgi:hypothetical protein